MIVKLLTPEKGVKPFVIMVEGASFARHTSGTAENAEASPVSI
jgi:hypothetical protein